MQSFEEKLSKYFEEFQKIVSSEKGDWTVKGFIDMYKNIYTISIDTKVVSKIIELMIFPVILKFGRDEGYEIILSTHQNHYPDVTFINKSTKEKFALDIKSTYRISKDRVNGMTLGAFTGYFRNKNSNKNITFPYSEYTKHFVLGVIYTKSDLYNAELVFKSKNIILTNTEIKKLSSYIASNTDENFESLLNIVKDNSEIDREQLRIEIDCCIIDEKQIFKLDQLNDISSIVRDFEFFVQEKWKIAIDRPGSGNTKNIGSDPMIKNLKNGTCLFTKFENGSEIFEDYWQYYLTKDMAKSVDLENAPYNNISTYIQYKSI